MDAHANENQSFLTQLSDSGRYDSEGLVVRHAKHLITDIRSYLKSSDYNMALACLDLAIKTKKGKLRDDGKTPSIIHEISQALYTISLIEGGVHLEDPESVIALNFIHDLGEDFGLKPETLKRHLEKAEVTDQNKIDLLAIDFDILTKKYKGESPKFKNEWEYYQAIERSQNASIAKPPDRLHNLATQIGVKKNKRALQYIANTYVIYDDLTRKASQRFPSQREAYTLYHEMIDTACKINRYHLVEAEIGKPLPDIETLAKEIPQHGFQIPDGLNPIFLNACRVYKLSDLPQSNRPPPRFDSIAALKNFTRGFNLL